MKAVVCTKKVLDPDAVNNYALEGRLEIGDDGKTMTQTSIPALMNAYDEQAIEAVLKLRDAGLDVSLAVVAVGTELADMLKHAAALGADEVTAIDSGGLELDNLGVAGLTGADLRICGVVDMPAHEARLNRKDPVHLFQNRLDAPETAGSKCRDIALCRGGTLGLRSTCW